MKKHKIEVVGVPRALIVAKEAWTKTEAIIYGYLLTNAEAAPDGSLHLETTVTKIADETRSFRQTVRRGLEKLEHAGLLVRTPGRTPRTPSTFVLTPEAM